MPELDKILIINISYCNFNTNPNNYILGPIGAVFVFIRYVQIFANICPARIFLSLHPTDFNWANVLNNNWPNRTLYINEKRFYVLLVSLEYLYWLCLIKNVQIATYGFYAECYSEPAELPLKCTVYFQQFIFVPRK